MRATGFLSESSKTESENAKEVSESVKNEFIVMVSCEFPWNTLSVPF